MIDGGPVGPKGCAGGIEGSIGFEVAVCESSPSRECLVEDLWKKCADQKQSDQCRE